MAMVVLGLNLIYGFNGQFSLAQWGFYGIGAYVAADITYRWADGDARGLLIVTIGVILGGLIIWGVNQLLKRYKGMPVLSAFTLYIIGIVAAGAVAAVIANALNPALAPLWGRPAHRGLEQRRGAAGHLLPRHPPGGRCFRQESAFCSACRC